jgi:hypothetical protein
MIVIGAGALLLLSGAVLADPVADCSTSVRIEEVFPAFNSEGGPPRFGATVTNTGREPIATSCVMREMGVLVDGRGVEPTPGLYSVIPPTIAPGGTFINSIDFEMYPLFFAKLAKGRHTLKVRIGGVESPGLPFWWMPVVRFYELYSWQSEGQGPWEFALLSQTCHSRSASEIFDPKDRFDGVQHLEQHLAVLPRGAQFAWVDRMSIPAAAIPSGGGLLQLPPREVFERIAEAMASRGMKLAASTPWKRTDGAVPRPTE